MGVEILRITYVKFHSSENKFMSSQLRKSRQRSEFTVELSAHRRVEDWAQDGSQGSLLSLWFGLSTSGLETSMGKVSERGPGLQCVREGGVSLLLHPSISLFPFLSRNKPVESILFITA